MKIIAFPDNTIAAGSAGFSASGMTVYADSSLMPNRRSWFVPDFGENWHGRVAIAFRVSRLGKSINAEFARRYYDAVTLAFVPDGDNLPDGAAELVDGAVVIGQWVMLDKLPRPLSVTVNGRVYSCGLPECHIDAALCESSMYASMKMGDIIVPAFFADVYEAMIGTEVVASLCGTELLNLQIK